MADETDLRAAASAFIRAAFDSLRRDHVIPTPVFHPYVSVGRDYYGPEMMGLKEYKDLKTRIEELYPTRFADPLTRPNPEFATTYIFSLLEAAVARCARVGDYGVRSDDVRRTIDELVDVLDSAEYEVVCCRVVAHLTTATGEDAEVGRVTVLPAHDEFRSLEQTVAEQIPGSVAAFNRDPPFEYDPPHALLVVRERTDEPDPYAVAARLSQRLERFLLHARLLTNGTIHSSYEMRGTTTLVSRMSPHLTTFLEGGVFRSTVRRTVRVAPAHASAIEALRHLIDGAEIKREGMVVTSFDVALRKFHGSFLGEPLDQLVDLATALEATLASGEKETEGLTLRLRSRAAALLATDRDPARAIFADVKHLYGLRSLLVHGGQLKEKDLRKTIDRISTMPSSSRPLMFRPALGHATDRLRDLVRRSILARLGLAVGRDSLWPFDARDLAVDELLTDDDTRREWRTRWHSRLTEAGLGEAAEQATLAVDAITQDDR